MKRIFLLFTLVSAITLSSCKNDDNYTYVDNDTISEVFQLTNLTFTPDGNGVYSYLYPLTPRLHDADMVLVYKRVGTAQNNPVWQIIPQTIYLDNGDELDYNFDFDLNNINLFMGSTFDLGMTPQFTMNQTFRVVIIPGYDNTAYRLDFSDYNTVMNHFNIQEKDVKMLN